MDSRERKSHTGYLAYGNSKPDCVSKFIYLFALMIMFELFTMITRENFTISIIDLNRQSDKLNRSLLENKLER